MTVMFMLLGLFGLSMLMSALLLFVLYVITRNNPEPYTPEEDEQQRVFLKKYWDSKSGTR
jgi:hypothetical protein